MLLELAEEAPAFKEQLVDLAQSWLALAAIDELINKGADQAYKAGLH